MKTGTDLHHGENFIIMNILIYASRVLVAASFAVFLACCNSGPSNFENAQAMMVPEGETEASSSTPIRKVIRTANITCRVTDVQQTRKQVDDLLKQNNAYLSGERQQNYAERFEFQREIRVPADAFIKLIGELESIAEEVVTREVTSQDVTEEFVDVEARLKTKQALESRYIDLLKRAQNVNEVLSIEKQIADVRGEIESMQGRLNLLQNQVSYSTIHFTFYTERPERFGFGSALGASFRDGWNNMLVFFIGLMRIWPFILITGVLTGWLMRRSRNKKIREALASSADNKV